MKEFDGEKIRTCDYIHSIPGKQNNCEKLTKEKMQSLIIVDMLSGPTKLRYSIGPEANEINRDQTVKGFNGYNKDFELFFLKAMGSHGGIIKNEQLRNQFEF